MPPPGGKGKEAEKIGPPMGEGAAPMSRMPDGGIAQPAARPAPVRINIAPAAPAPMAPALQPAPATAPAEGTTEPRPF
jgi:DamX protein